jgi:signal transduction histidine kinase
MGHGGSAYDIPDHFDVLPLLDLIADNCSSDPGLSNKIMAIRAKWDKTLCPGLRALIGEPSKKIEAGTVSDKDIQDWESRLEEQLKAFKEIQAEFAGLKDKISSNKNFDEGSSAMLENAVQEWRSILEQGVNFTKGIVKKEKVNLNAIINKAIESRKDFVKFKENPGDPIYIHADPMTVLQIITNIIVNANKLKAKAELTKVIISAELSSNNKEVIIEITDDGPGFDENMLKKNSEKDGSQEVMFGYGITYNYGSGFGLAENKIYAKLHNGSFRVFSRTSGENRGSTFIIKLSADLSAANIVEEPIKALQTAI